MMETFSRAFIVLTCFDYLNTLLRYNGIEISVRDILFFLSLVLLCTLLMLCSIISAPCDLLDVTRSSSMRASCQLRLELPKQCLSPFRRW